MIEQFKRQRQHEGCGAKGSGEHRQSSLSTTPDHGDDGHSLDASTAAGEGPLPHSQGSTASPLPTPDDDQLPCSRRSRTVRGQESPPQRSIPGTIKLEDADRDEDGLYAVFISNESKQV